MFNTAKEATETRRSFTVTELAQVRDSSGLWTVAKTVEFFYNIPIYPGLEPGKYALVESYQHGDHTRRQYRQRFILMDDPVAACDAQERLMSDPNKEPDTVYFVLSGDGRSYHRRQATAGASMWNSRERTHDLRGAFLEKPPEKKARPPAIAINPFPGEGESGVIGNINNRRWC